MNTRLHSAFRSPFAVLLRRTGIPHSALLLALLSTLNYQPSTYGQGTAFTYQGQLFDNGTAANGNYAMQFTLYTNATSALNVLAGPLTLAPVAVSNGLFTVLLDFGPGEFTGPPRWLQIYAATNSASPPYLPLSPRQLLSPAPYAIFANTASNLSGSLPTAQLSGNIPTTQLSGTVNNSQLASNSITISPGTGLSGGGTVALGGSTSLAIPSGGVSNAMLANPSLTVSAGTGLSGGGTVALGGSTSLAIPSGAVGNSMLANPSLTVSAGTGLSGGGTVALGGSTTLNNSGVLSVVGNADISASTVSGAVTLGDNATSSATPSTLVKRDAGGSFSATNLTLNGNLNLPATTASAGIIYSAGSSLLHTYGGNFFAGLGAGNLTMSGGGNTGTGSGVLGINTSGSFNTADGESALFNNTSGSNNVANGVEALMLGFSGNNNVANGYRALLNNTGDGNVAEGYQTLQANTGGNHNTAIGGLALQNNQGSGNLALGYLAGSALNTGGNNIEIGNNGVDGENGIVRIGQGQSDTYLSGNVHASAASFGSHFGQTLNLYGTDYGIGVQLNREYFRCGPGGNTNAGFVWFLGGSHDDATDNAGSGGGRMMGLTYGTTTVGGSSGHTVDSILTVYGEIAATDDVYGYSFQSTSDRNKKDNFMPVVAQAILEKVMALPITSWNFTNSPAVKHIGPMAQDFHAAFALNGLDDTHIASVDEGGVALAAIQGLNEKVESGKQKAETRMEKLEAENADLKQQLAAIQKEMTTRLAVLEKAVARVADKSENTLAATSGEK